MNEETLAPVTRRTPVLLIIFNRPDTTAQVLKAIRNARPERLFVASDGPRPHVPEDAERVVETRAVVERMLDWPCRVQRRYSDVNLGCGPGPASAISWFFEHVEEGIILEDDCVPHPDFFEYCTELLERYRSNQRVMSIAGDNSVGLTLTDTTASYCFTRQALIWGWATWRRAWKHYDGELELWRSLRVDSARQRQIWSDPIERRSQAKKLDRLLRTGHPDVWDQQWSFTIAERAGLCVTPRVNLVSNIGFGEYATHTTAAGSTRDAVSTQAILPLRHPRAISPDVGVERQIFDRVHGGRALRSPVRRFLRPVRALVRGIVSDSRVKARRRRQA